MNFEGGFFLILGLVFIVPALYGLSLLVNWVAGRKLIPRWLPVALIAGALIGGSVYLDSAGVVTPVKIISKNDSIHLGRNGSWSRKLSVQVEYRSPDEIGATPIALRCDARTFDALREGQTVETRVLDLGRNFKFARLKNRSTFSFIAEGFSRSPDGPWREATALVSELTHVTEYSNRRDVTQLRWPYDIVQLSFTPDGGDHPIIAVDVVEAASAPNLMKGQTVRILWPEDDPRSAKIVGARPGAPWANWFFNLGEIIAIGGAVIVLAILAGAILRRRGTPRRWWK